jgi:oligopeptide transport system substrate-binding protein
MRAWRTWALAGAALGALTLTGCDSGGSRRPPCPAGKVCYERGNVIDPLTLDPLKATTVNEDHLLGDMFTGLLQFDPKGEPVAGMATSWETSADGLTWTFHLRQDAKWSDGVPLTSDDFVFSLRRLMDPKFASEYAYILYIIANAEAVNGGKLPVTALGVDAPDAYTLRIHLIHPVPYLLRVVTHQTMYPVPKHVIEKYGDQWTDPRHWVSNGPYIIKSWTLGDRIHAVKNPNFYDAKSVCIDEVNYHPGQDAIAVERSVRRGEVDSANDIQSNRIAYLRKPDQIPDYVHVGTWLGTTYVGFNPAIPAFKDVRVRQALTMAIDRDFITQKLMRGGQAAAYTLVPPGVASYPGSQPPHWAGWSLERRQIEARRLMAEAGFTPQHPLKFEFKMRNTNDPQLIYPAVQADWRAVGAEASLYPEESQIAYSDYSARSFQAADIAWIADYNDPMTFLYLMKSTTGPQNYSDYKNPVYDALLDKADHDIDIVTRGQDLAKAEHIAMEDATIAPIFYYVSKNLVSPKITGWVDNLSDWHRTRYLCFAGHKSPG